MSIENKGAGPGEEIDKKKIENLSSSEENRKNEITPDNRDQYIEKTQHSITGFQTLRDKILETRNHILENRKKTFYAKDMQTEVVLELVKILEEADIHTLDNTADLTEEALGETIQDQLANLRLICFDIHKLLEKRSISFSILMDGNKMELSDAFQLQYLANSEQAFRASIDQLLEWQKAIIEKFSEGIHDPKFVDMQIQQDYTEAGEECPYEPLINT